MTTAASYSKFDRLVYQLAFSGQTARLALSNIEDRIIAVRIKQVSIDEPVFITSMACRYVFAN